MLNLRALKIFFSGLRQIRSQQGIYIVFTAILLTFMVGLIGLQYTMSSSDITQAQLNAAADSAALDAISAFKQSSLSGYSMMVASALNAIERHRVQGSFGELDQVDFSIADEIAKSPNSVYVAGSSNTFTSGDISVEIHRGFYGPSIYGDVEMNSSFEGAKQKPINANPANLNMEFLSFDDEALRGRVPDFMAANAVQVTVRKHSLSSLLDIFSPGGRSFDMEATAIAVAGNPEEEICVAPFAVPVCALLNSQGEYDQANSCHFDRFFTRSDRYCGDSGDDTDDCNILPGVWWAPLSSFYCEDEWWAENQPWRCACYNDPAACPIPGQVTSHSCNFFQWPILGETSDHFGVVGLPETFTIGRGFVTDGNSGLNANSAPEFGSVEGYIREAILRSNSDVSEAADFRQFCVPAKLGDSFFILEDGLVEPETNDAMWEQITDRTVGGGGDDDYHYFQDQTSLGRAWYVGRVEGSKKSPTDIELQFLEFVSGKLGCGCALVGDDYTCTSNDAACLPIKHTLENRIDPSHPDPEHNCNGLEQWGVCNSQRTAYDERCEALHKNWTSPVYQPDTPPSDYSQYLFANHDYDLDGTIEMAMESSGWGPATPGGDDREYLTYVNGLFYDGKHDDKLLQEAWGYRDDGDGDVNTARAFTGWAEPLPPDLGYSYTDNNGIEQTITWNGWTANYLAHCHCRTDQVVDGTTIVPDCDPDPNINTAACDFWDYNCDNVGTHTACALPKATFTDNSPLPVGFDYNNPDALDYDPNTPAASKHFSHSDNTKVWQIKVPVIANFSDEPGDGETVCAQTNPGASVNDHYISTADDVWRVIGFVEVNFFDNDIGLPAPAIPGNMGINHWSEDTVNNGLPSGKEWWDYSWLRHWFRGSDGYDGVGAPVSASKAHLPRVCPYDNDAGLPWAFDPEFDPDDGYSGDEPHCNMIRGRVTCDNGIIASPSDDSTIQGIRLVR